MRVAAADGRFGPGRIREYINAVRDLQRNQVLARLPAHARDAIAGRLHQEDLAVGHVLRNEHEPVRRVYFPIDAVISIVSLMEDGAIAESYTAGCDGMEGLEVLWASGGTIFRSMCQIPGTCYWIDVEEFCDAVNAEPAWRDTTLAYTHCLMALAGRSAACSMLHQVVERCARWLLISHDRVRKDTFELTQEILATMLGVHRPAVTVAAGTLQKAGLIRYTRGRMTIVDRERLEDASCECYKIVADEFCRVLGGPRPMR